MCIRERDINETLHLYITDLPLLFPLVLINMCSDLSSYLPSANKLCLNPSLNHLTLDSPTILSTVRDYLASAREEDSFTKNIVMEKGVKSGEGRKSELRGPARRFSNQLMMETVSMPTLRWTLLKRGEEVWSDPFADETNSENK